MDKRKSQLCITIKVIDKTYQVSYPKQGGDVNHTYEFMIISKKGHGIYHSPNICNANFSALQY